MSNTGFHLYLMDISVFTLYITSALYYSFNPYPQKGISSPRHFFFTSTKNNLFSLLHNWIHCREFCKRMDPELPFHYWTANERYMEWEEELPSFNERPDVNDDQDATNHPLRLHRLTINRREDSSIFTAGRSFLPARNQTTIRQRIHRPVVNLPPNPH